MARMKELTIPFSGMKEGKYEFSALLNDSFFESLEFSEIQKGEIKVKIELERRTDLLNLRVSMDGTVEQVCDRCGNTYNQEISDERNLVVNLNAESFQDEDDLISLPSTYSELDLSQYIYEYIALAIPHRKICPDQPGCDPEVLARLKQLDSDNQKESSTNDPRWDVLKNFKENN